VLCGLCAHEAYCRCIACSERHSFRVLLNIAQYYGFPWLQENVTWVMRGVQVDVIAEQAEEERREAERDRDDDGDVPEVMAY